MGEPSKSAAEFFSARSTAPSPLSDEDGAAVPTNPPADALVGESASLSSMEEFRALPSEELSPSVTTAAALTGVVCSDAQDVRNALISSDTSVYAKRVSYEKCAPMNCKHILTDAVSSSTAMAAPKAGAGAAYGWLREMNI